MTLDPHPFDLKKMLNDLSVILTPSVGSKPVSIVFDVDPQVPSFLVGDAMRIQQVLLNLGSNAIKFTAEGEVHLSIGMVQRSAEAVTLQFSMRDSGIGIAPENQARIFSGFTQAESSTTRRFGGTGLGVAISQRFVQMMGGELELQSVLGEGSRFYFTVTLPVAAAPVVSADALGHADGLRLEGMRLLLVEDNLNNQQIACELLQGEGATVQVANHGQEGVDAITRTPTAFDVVLMDLQMPVMDGLTATRFIRTQLGMTALPIVAMTANAMASDREACLDAGMNDHVGKPFDLNDLVRVLRQQAKWSAAEHTPSEVAGAVSPIVLDVATAAGVDLNNALHRIGGKQDVYRRMLATFVKDLNAMPAQLRDCALQANTESAKRLLHTLKGLAATLGATPLSVQAARGEKQLVSEPHSPTDTEVLAEVCEQACTAIGQAHGGLQKLLDALQQTHAELANTSPVASTPVDTTALLSALQAMEQLLRGGDMEAMQAMAELEQQHGDALGERLGALQEAMSDMDFERALVECQHLMASLNND
jgi:CheY-like chemotaxis protein